MTQLLLYGQIFCFFQNVIAFCRPIIWKTIHICFLHNLNCPPPLSGLSVPLYPCSHFKDKYGMEFKSPTTFWAYTFCMSLEFDNL